MTNEKKERLKEIIDSLLNSNMGTTGELNYQEMMWFQETIHSLLDRVPSEEEAKRAWDIFLGGLSACEQENETSCGLCVNLSACQKGQETIRKALGIEGKE